MIGGGFFVVGVKAFTGTTKVPDFRQNIADYQQLTNKILLIAMLIAVVLCGLFVKSRRQLCV